MNIESILRRKGEGVVTIPCDHSIGEALDMLAEEDIGALVVSDGDERLEGILSERDIVRALARSGADVLHWPVGKLMNRDVVTCVGEELVAGIMAIMTERRTRHVPVMEAGQIRGIVTIDTDQGRALRLMAKPRKPPAGRQRNGSASKAENMVAYRTTPQARFSNVKEPITAVRGFTGERTTSDGTQRLEALSAHLRASRDRWRASDVPGRDTSL